MQVGSRDDVRRWSQCRALYDASVDIGDGRHETGVPSAVSVAVEKITNPVVNTVRHLQLCELGHQCRVPDRVERLREEKRWGNSTSFFLSLPPIPPLLLPFHPFPFLFLPTLPLPFPPLPLEVGYESNSRQNASRCSHETRPMQPLKANVIDPRQLLLDAAMGRPFRLGV